MTEEEMVLEARELSRWQRHKFIVLVGLVIGIAIVLVLISLRLYITSGAIQLDLSRPGYQGTAVEEEEATVNDFERFPSSGSLDGASIEEFRRLYNERLEEVTAVDSFGGDVMSDAALGIDAPTPTE